MDAEGSTYRWAVEEFGLAQLGDRRRTDRLVLMAASAAKRPAGKVSDVFLDVGEMHGAYDFLESKHCKSAALTHAMGQATALRARRQEYLEVAVDGSSVTLTDRARSKGFGTLGSAPRDSRGLKVISAFAMQGGAPLGVVAQTWWTRQGPPVRQTLNVGRVKSRPVEEKETQRWIDTIRAARARCDARELRPWFLIDREGDGSSILRELQGSGARFTIRGNACRVATAALDSKRLPVRNLVMRGRVRGTYTVDLEPRKGRQPRTARLDVRALRLNLRLRGDRRSRRFEFIALNVVLVRERGRTPRGEKPIDWLLYTNAPIDTTADIHQIIRGYTHRWRVEDFHRTWKSGACNTEQTQVRSVEAAVKWATILAAVAARIERLKHLSRKTPDAPASVEFGASEVRVAVALAARITKRDERPPTERLTIKEATHWIARLGGYTGNSSGGPPGSITIRRGLERLEAALEGARAMGALDD